MRATWLLAVMVGASIGAAPVELEAQSQSSRARIEQAREAERREAERERIREAREQERARVAGTTVRSTVGRNDERDRRRDDRYDDWDDRFDSRSNDRNGKGPAFCRSGAGHPVHGRQWCRDKGFGLGNGANTGSIWGDIILRQPRERRYDQSMGRSVLADILGSVVLGRFESYGRQYTSGSMTGRWVPDNSRNVLELTMGGVPIARLIDTNRDGRVDSVITRR